MHQTKISLADSQFEFLKQYQALGYRDMSSLVRDAIDELKQKIAKKQLEESADLYAEVYAEDEVLQSLTEQALEGWPE